MYVTRIALNKAAKQNVESSPSAQEPECINFIMTNRCIDLQSETRWMRMKKMCHAVSEDNSSDSTFQVEWVYTYIVEPHSSV